MADSGELLGEAIPDDAPVDIEMGGEDVVVEIDAAAAAAAAATGTAAGAAENGENELPFQQEETIEEVPARVTYIDYLKSPIIGLLVGQGPEQALLTAHQALLTQSPWFADACAKFSDEVSVSFLPPPLPLSFPRGSHSIPSISA
jgi:hypothetical protein